MERTLDYKGRWRNHTVAFRVSDEEAKLLNDLVALSGLTKQDYITRRLLCRDVVVQGNPRVYKALRNELSDVLAVWEQGNAALHPGGTFLEDPIRDEIGMPIGFALGRDLKKGLPRIASLMRHGESSQTISFRDILSDRMALVAMNPAFALFKINGIGRQVPMDHRMAPSVEVQPFLAN